MGPPGGEFEICTERADFYRDNYLALAAGGGSAMSGSWNKWYRSAGGAWMGPDTASYDNWFGLVCAVEYSWCAEVNLAGHVPGVDPAGAPSCEVFDGFSCSDGTWELTLRIGVDRLSACGF